jgi:twitching motility protein PilT
MPSRVQAFLELAVQQGGSDLHLVSGRTPSIRLHGVLHQVRFRELSVEDIEEILSEFMTERQEKELAEKFAVDFAYDVPGLGRFRVNAYRHVRGLAAALRVIPGNVPSFDTLGFAQAIKLQALQPKGLTLVTGATGSGKSTTLAGIIDLINETRKGHIITLEDPIEFLHDFKKCVVTQREMGLHARSFADALRDAVREDPDVILVGELRDLESIALALTAAETGIQVLATLHTSSARRTIDRIINVFPSRRQDQIRSMLADSLRMVISQRLVRKADGTGRVAAADILVNTHAAASMIRSGNSHKLESVMQSGANSGMQSLDGSLKELVRRKIITADEAMGHSLDPTQFEHMARDQAA